jgi:hypothetical protein
MLCKRCRSTHKEANKIGFAFFQFFCELTCFSQATGPKHKETKNLISTPTLELWKNSQIYPWFAQRSLRRNRSSQGCPSAAGGAHRRWYPARPGQQMARGIIDAHPSSIGCGGWVGAASGKGRRWDSGGTAASARVPAKCGVELGHEWMWKLGWVQGRSSESLVDHGCERRDELANGGGNSGRQRSWLAQGRKGWGFIGGAARRGGFA